MLPAAVKEPLLRHLKAVKRQHEEDLKRGLGRVSCPMPLSANIPTQARSGDGSGFSQPQATIPTG